MYGFSGRRGKEGLMMDEMFLGTKGLGVSCSWGVFESVMVRSGMCVRVRAGHAGMVYNFICVCFGFFPLA